MYIYTDDLTEFDLLYDNKGERRNFTRANSKEFRKMAIEALENNNNVNKWIAVYEPSLRRDGKLQCIPIIQKMGMLK